MFRKYKRAQVEDFLREIDGHLTKACDVVLIGGAVLSLVYKGSHATADVDYYSAADEFQVAYAAAQKSSAAPIPVQKAAIVQPPFDFEDRLLEFDLPRLLKLRILVPERHDFVVMKFARGEAHDLDAIEDVHRAEPLNLETLIERYHGAKTQVIGSLTDHRLKFLATVDRLFGPDAATRVEQRLSTS